VVKPWLFLLISDSCNFTPISTDFYRMKVNDDLLKKIKIYAATENISISALVRNFFEKLVDNQLVIKNIDKDKFNILKSFSERKIKASTVMRRLNIERREIYLLLGKYGLNLPQESDIEAIADAKKIASIIKMSETAR
jgi:hypothetical protein